MEPVNLYNAYGKNIGDRIIDIDNSKSPFFDGYVISTPAIDNSLFFYQNTRHKLNQTNSNSNNNNNNNNINNDMLTNNSPTRLLFTIDFDLNNSPFIQHFYNLNHSIHPCWSIQYHNQTTPKPFKFIHDLSKTDKFASIVNKNNIQKDGITYNNKDDNLISNKKYPKQVDDRRHSLLFGRFGDMKSWVYKSKNQGVPDQSPRNYTDTKLTQDEIDLLSKGPKHIVITTQPDFYEMHEMFRKMERIIKGRWYAFRKINKYSELDKQNN